MYVIYRHALCVLVICSHTHRSPLFLLICMYLVIDHLDGFAQHILDSLGSLFSSHNSDYHLSPFLWVRAQEQRTQVVLAFVLYEALVIRVVDYGNDTV